MPNKKETRKAVYEKLSGARAEYESKLNKKKSKNKRKKASNLCAVDIVRSFKKELKNGHAKQEVTN